METHVRDAGNSGDPDLPLPSRSSRPLCLGMAWAQRQDGKPQPWDPEPSPRVLLPLETCPQSCPPIPRGPSQAWAINVLFPE